jgi:hypothetical protein
MRSRATIAKPMISSYALDYPLTFVPPLVRDWFWAQCSRADVMAITKCRAVENAPLLLRSAVWPRSCDAAGALRRPGHFLRSHPPSFDPQPVAAPAQPQPFCEDGPLAPNATHPARFRPGGAVPPGDPPTKITHVAPPLSQHGPSTQGEGSPNKSPAVRGGAKLVQLV